MERSATAIDAHVDELVRRCRAEGMNVTPQRIAVYRALLESTQHPSPESLYREVRQAMPSLSLATIYKTLETLERLGLVHEVPVISDTKRYDANTDPHHHLVCKMCGRVTDYYSDELDAAVPRRAIRGFVPESVTVNVTGTCPDCRRERVH